MLDHTGECDWHVDQYDFECTCGAVVADPPEAFPELRVIDGPRRARVEALHKQRMYEASRRVWAAVIGLPYEEDEMGRTMTEDAIAHDTAGVPTWQGFPEMPMMPPPPRWLDVSGAAHGAAEPLLTGTEWPVDMVNHPPHYTAHPSGVECIQITEHMGFNLGNAVKYVWRADTKGNAIEDLEKAVWYLQREIAKRKSAP